MRAGLTKVSVRGFRTARDTSLAPGVLCALVGEASAGKSNLLAAIRALLDADAPVLLEDVAVGKAGLSLRGSLANGDELTLEGRPPSLRRSHTGAAPAVLFLPAVERAGTLLGGKLPDHGGAEPALELFRAGLDEQAGSSSATPALSLVAAVGRCCALGIRGLVFLIEEPELFLRPQAQRFLYRLLRELAAGGNQVIYSTHSPAFLNVARLEEIAFVERRAEDGTQVLQPQPLSPADEFRAVTEFDAERSELFLARSAVLVEGMTEKLALPFVFRTLGYDADREGVSIVECGGKASIPVVARICRAAGVPFVVMHDRDAPREREPVLAERNLNALIVETAGKERVFALEPDFEGVTGLKGGSHKPERAWRRFASLEAGEIPEPLAAPAALAVELARAV